MDRVELRPSRVVPGGDAIARGDDGRVVFVDGAIPGEVVIAQIVEERKDFRRAVTLRVLEASPDRIAPPCPNVSLGCGGCGWQHVAVAAQHRLKQEMVADALVRIAKLDPSSIPSFKIVPLLTTAFRTTVRVSVEHGRARFHRAASDDLVDASHCYVAHPLVAELLDDGWFGTAKEAVVRVGVASGERAVLVRPTAADVRLPADVTVVDDRDRSPSARRGVVHEVIRGRTLQASIRSFFQASPNAAAALVEEVVTALRTAGALDAVADLYAGVGLFADAIAQIIDGRVVAIERDRSAVADAKENLRGSGVRVVRSDVGTWRPDRSYDGIVADPARPGLGRPGIATVVSTGATVVVLVSCDAASFARDARLLADHGFGLRTISLVDAFPHTPHVEVVSSFQPF